jgi:PAS domain S-box-containing protein
MDGIISVNNSGTILLFNPAAEQIFGYSENEVLGLSFNLLLHELSLDLYRGIVQDLSHSKSNNSLINEANPQLVGRRSNGEEFPMEISVAYTDIPEGKLLTTFVRDISERKALERQILQVQKMDVVGQVAAGIAHDFGNILGGIVGFSELIALDVPPSTKPHLYAKNIIKASQLGRDLLRKLLLFSQIGERQVEALRVSAVVDETLNLLSSMIPPNINIVTELKKHSDFVLADRIELQQIILNLTINSLHSMQTEVQDSGEVKVSVNHVIKDSHDHFVELAISDTGCGMTQEVLEKIFEPFFTTKAPGKGTGFGLCVVRTIIKDLNGTIDVKSKLGEGTTFTILIPAADPSQHEEIPLTTDYLRILVVNEDPTALGIASEILREQRHNVFDFTNPFEAIRRMSASPEEFDLLLVDDDMPQMSGEMLSIRCKQLNPNLSVIITSGNPPTQGSKSFDGKSNVLFLSKPYSTAELKLAIGAVQAR